MARVSLEVGTLQISFATHASLSPAAANIMEVGTPLEIEMSLLNLADDAARESSKFDLTANRAARYRAAMCAEWQVAAPVTATTLDLYYGPSDQATALNGNPGYMTGSDAAYAGGPATLAEGLSQLQFIGPLVLTADIEFQIGEFGILVPTARHGGLVLVNKGGQVLCDTDINETNIVLTPIDDDVATS